MDTLYGSYNNEQFEQYKIQLHKEMFWLLLYKDPKTKDKYKNIDFEKYFVNLMKKLDGLNEIYSSPFPDYTFEPLGSLGEIGVLILGAVICLAGGFVIGKIIEKRG